MKVHIRYDKHEGQHTHFTVFINGANTGTLCMDTEEAADFHCIVSAGCSSVARDEFISSGEPPEPKEPGQ